MLRKTALDCSHRSGMPRLLWSDGAGSALPGITIGAQSCLPCWNPLKHKALATAVTESPSVSRLQQ